MYEGLVGVHHLLEVDGFVGVVGERLILIEVLVSVDDGLRVGVAVELHHFCSEDAACEVAAVWDEVNGGFKMSLYLLQTLFDFRHVLVTEGFIDAEVVDTPREVGRSTGLHTGARGACDGVDADVGGQQPELGSGEQSELDAGGKASGIGDMFGMGDLLTVDFRQTVDEVVGLGGGVLGVGQRLWSQAEVLSQVDDLHAFGNVVGLHESLTLAVSEAEEDDIHVAERHVLGEDQVGIAIEPLVDVGHGVAGIALAVGEDNLGTGMMDEETDQLAAGIAGSTENSYFYK